MHVKMKAEVFSGYSWKRLLYTVCFIMFCVIDQRTKTGSGLDGIVETFGNLTGIVLAVIIISHYKREDYEQWRVPYLIWSIAGSAGGAGMFLWGLGHRPFMNAWLVAVFDVFIWGYIIIYTFINVVIEKKSPVLDKRFLIIWSLMMVLMVISRSRYIWPLCYFLMFGCFYMTDFTQEERDDLWQGCLDGLILSFILFQGYCCVFRPYDVARYRGIYTNSNLNALYYLAVLAAVFVRILQMNKSKANKWLKFLHWLSAGCVLGFLILTIGRIAWITAFVIGIVFLKLLNIIIQKKRFLRNGALLVLCLIVMFLVLFGATRYLPPRFHHPVWFWGEWSEQKVHSWDPWNSEKYVDIDEFFDEAAGRISESIKTILNDSPFLIRSKAEEDPRVEAAVLKGDQEWGTLVIRGTIYRYYFSHLNWRGYPYEEQGFQLTRDYWIGHAHNIYLQYGTDFGIPVMILFSVLIIWSCAGCWKRAAGEESLDDAAALLFILIPAIFGLAEYAWGVGSLSITMLFIAWRQVIQRP